VKKWVYILLLTIFFSGFIQAGEEKDTLSYAKKENLQTQTISYDSTTYNKFKKQEFYNYYNVRIKEPSLSQKLYERFNRWLQKNTNKTIETNTFDTILWIIGIIVLIVILIILFINKSGIFYFNKKNPLVYNIEEEDIEGQDFDKLREQSFKEGNYSDAIRWQYLKVLKILHEKRMISYESNKTVYEYAYEIKDTELRKHFKNLSQKFIYHRYGKGAANEENFSEFYTQSEELLKISGK
jgi:hypothetical protein